MPGILGISLGISSLCCGCFKSSHVNIVPCHDGNTSFNSCVYFDPTSNKVETGETILYTSRMIDRAIYDPQRIIGLKYNDTLVKEYQEKHSCNIINDKDIPKFEIEFNHKTVYKTAAEITSELLRSVKLYGDTYVGRLNQTTDVVLTVPLYFNKTQREETKKAAEMANFKVLKIIDEPVAACTAYTLERKFTGNHVLVYDFGGCTFQVTLLYVNKKTKKMNIIKSETDYSLGGNEITYRIVDYFLEELDKKLGGKRNSIMLRKIKELHICCERAKQVMCSENCKEVDIGCEWLEENEVSCVLTKDIMDKVSSDLIDKTIVLVMKLLEESKKDVNDISNIILCGGSSNISKIKELLREKFHSCNILRSINPSEVLAYGSTLYGNVDECKYDLQ